MDSSPSQSPRKYNLDPCLRNQGRGDCQTDLGHIADDPPRGADTGGAWMAADRLEVSNGRHGDGLLLPPVRLLLIRTPRSGDSRLCVALFWNFTLIQGDQKERSCYTVKFAEERT